MALVLINDKDEVLVIERAQDPGKGMWDLPGGFCYATETLEQATVREVAEEIGLQESDYSSLEFVLSAVNIYDYDGESRPVLDVVFKARMRSATQPVAGDDAAKAMWVPLNELDLDKIAFPSIRTALQQIIQAH